MSLFGFLKRPDINQGVEQYRSTAGAALIDVRTPEEYAAGHIPGSRNIPLDRLRTASGSIPDKNTPLFVYCLSGARSRQAVSYLSSAGYTAVTDIGAFSNYQGKAEK